MRIVVACLLLSALLAMACGDGDSEQDDCSTSITPRSDAPANPSWTPSPICGVTPPPHAQPSPTLDLRSPLPPDAAKEWLSRFDPLRNVLDAVEERNIGRLLDLIDWESVGCGGRSGSDACPPGVASGTRMPMLDVGGGTVLWLRADSITRPLTEVLAGPPLRLYAAWSRPIAGTLRRIYYVGLAGEPRPVTPSFIWGDAKTASGMLLILQGGSARPILKITFLHDDSWPSEIRSLLNDGGDILTYNP